MAHGEIAGPGPRDTRFGKQNGGGGGNRTHDFPLSNKDLQQTIALNRGNNEAGQSPALAQLAQLLVNLTPEDKALLAALLLGNQGGQK